MSWFVFVVRLSDRYGAVERDRVIQGLHRHEVGAANYFPCIHLQPYLQERFGYRVGLCPAAEDVASRTLALPFHARLAEDDQAFVAEALAAALE